VLGRKKVCFISGKFNVVHAGHLRLFRHAKEIADRLIVGIYIDSYDLDGEILVSEVDRIEGVRSNVWVDQVVIVENIEKTLLQYKPDIVLKGKEHYGQFNVENDIVARYGGALKFAGGDTRLSSWALLQAETDNRKSVLQRSRGFLDRHRLSIDSLSSVIESVAKVRVLVIGDLILDRYIDCQPVGLSSEDPTVVVSPLNEQTFVGGAGIVAAHAASLGASSTFVSVCGDDGPGRSVRDLLVKSGVEVEVMVDADRPTTRKTRYRADNQTLLRVNEFRDHQIDQQLAEKITNCVLNHLPSKDLLIFSDFSYGVFSDEMIRAITDAGRSQGLVMGADSQSSSQIGDITRFSNVSLITPTEREARLAVRDNRSGLVGISEKVKDATNVSCIPITLGSEGVFLHRPDADGKGWSDDQVPALNDSPVDVSGAGDAFLVATSLSLASKADIWSAIFIGSVAAACQVGTLGNTPLRRDELLAKLRS
jgi:rfaE bifunctional protein kinase chain/domain